MALTKTDLQAIDQLISQKFEEQKTEFAGMKDEIVVMKDEIVKELRDFREEFDVHQASHVRINDELEDHDDRIKKLEHVPA